MCRENNKNALVVKECLTPRNQERGRADRQRQSATMVFLMERGGVPKSPRDDFRHQRRLKRLESFRQIGDFPELSPGKEEIPRVPDEQAAFPWAREYFYSETRGEGSPGLTKTAGPCTCLHLAPA